MYVFMLWAKRPIQFNSIGGASQSQRGYALRDGARWCGLAAETSARPELAHPLVIW